MCFRLRISSSTSFFGYLVVCVYFLFFFFRSIFICSSERIKWIAFLALLYYNSAIYNMFGYGPDLDWAVGVGGFFSPP